ncbi:Uncharacterized protein APZ42_022125 [Daphnia magna]|uniref:Uncharacterized protein n=1 Tax=Daphnia magna TaxID=35525 RepID=A0A164W1Q2_9CRUS|nr:Uncharacterized protein APZ42_022125 [Daphnia magna]
MECLYKISTRANIAYCMGRIIGHLCSARILTFSLRIVVRCPYMRQVIDVSRSTKKRRKGRVQVKETIMNQFSL